MTYGYSALALLGFLSFSTGAYAQSPGDDPVTLDRIRVQATRLIGVGDFDTPASVHTVSLGDDGNGDAVDVSDALGSVPGLLARDRQNYAQDTQLSIRGFGARSTFGVRGVRLFSDGIPASMPDGQGQLSHFNVLGGERIEIMRGPFSALYGNSSGGVVQLWSAEGKEGDPWRVRATAGGDDAYTLGAQLRGAHGDLGYNLAASRFDTQGYRDHSAARRDSLNARFDFRIDPSRKLTLVLNHVDLPDADDPLGLTRAQYQADPRQAAAVATQFDTRKSVRQSQGGLTYEQQVGNAQTWRVMAYAGRRVVEQFLALPVAAQANPLNAGGVIDLASDYGGADLRWSWQGELASKPFELTAGADFDQQDQQRRGYENFIGTTLGVRGALRRNESNRVRNVDRFAQAWWRFAPRWSLLAGARHSEVEFTARDRYVAAGNPDDSGEVRFRETTPVAGLMFEPGEDLRFYVSAGRGFETPTFNELGYRADGGAGLAFDLQPAISRNVELGMKWRGEGDTRLEAALFRADTDDELAVVRNVGGRSSFRNVARARRQGLETSFETALSDQWRLQLAYTWLDATFRSAYLVCTGAGCTVPSTPVAAGSRIPGVARQQLFGRLQWRGSVWSAAAEGEGVGDVVVNDVASESAPGYFLLHLEAAREWKLPSGSLRAFARIDNALDHGYIGSVIVNEGNGRFYEPGPGRTFLVGAQWQWSR
ncbi:TonB-dependent receptor family protein [Pseudoxanthomonas sacheonensis]|uniref:TonB-dependent receptor family protein n=1 Tax=Pseudoxanthomonas sacheonensis TaxID=443615 RepID=UPI0013D114BD|nr:TonB-dependent receptor [Pseudoxanthomonas sacheonensis]KAF1708995.1 TonB-dependent receptor [Pseudoxanthomonas sacheonensis]